MCPPINALLASVGCEKVLGEEYRVAMVMDLVVLDPRAKRRVCFVMPRIGIIGGSSLQN